MFVNKLINFFAISVIIVISFIQAYMHIRNQIKHSEYQYYPDVLFPSVMITIDAVLLFAAVFRVWRILKADQQLSINEAYMTLNVIILVFFAVCSFFTFFSYRHNS